MAAVAASWPETLGARVRPWPRLRLRCRATADQTAAGAARRPSVQVRIARVLRRARHRRAYAAAASRRASGAQAPRVAVVSESIARQLWPNLDAVGQALRLEPDPESATPSGSMNRALARPRLHRRRGSPRDVTGFRLRRCREADVYVPISAEAAKTSLTLRVHGDPERAQARARRTADGDRPQHGPGRHARDHGAKW